MTPEQFKDSIFLDSKKCNAELLTIHADGRITAAEHLKPTETAAEVLRIMRETWMADAQSTKIRDQQERIKRLEEALGLVRPHCSFVHHLKKYQHAYNEPCPVVALIEKTKEAKL
jgi:hypothetical protein